MCIHVQIVIFTAKLYTHVYRWINECGDILRNFQSHWKHLVPKASSDPALLAEKFFNCVFSLMSIQLRQIVESSLNELIQFFSLYKVCYSLYSPPDAV